MQTLDEYKRSIIAELRVQLEAKQRLKDQVQGEILGLEEAIETLNASDSRSDVLTAT